MGKTILLVEPAYESRYPPLGLMKLAFYHRIIKGDEVTFVKGCKPQLRDEYWDRVYITTLFTYTWKETVKTIKFYRDTIFSFTKKMFVGGILASLLPNELFDETGIQATVGLLENSSIIGYEDEVNIDNLPPDYEILNQVDFKYDHIDAYIGYTTRGCPRKCEFCAVKMFEPRYISYIDFKKSINEVKKRFGEKRNLLLMDNNVLFSKDFDKIIDDIKEEGFIKGAFFGKTRRRRNVDFNQGLDPRILTESKMRRLAEIPLEPMRLAFDDMSYKDEYIDAVRKANKHGQKEMSSYILYNYKDTPEDFYNRLLINVNLNEEFKGKHINKNSSKTTIYSFPMRYIPLNAKNRKVDTGNKYWNKRYLRGVQVILSVIRGPVMPGKQFFEQAFGRNAEEFKEILLMPDEFIRYRVKKNWAQIKIYENRLMPYVKEWKNTYHKISSSEKKELIAALSSNEMKLINEYYENITNKYLNELIWCHLNAKDIVNKEKK